jgi:signal transduction histidine kinase
MAERQTEEQPYYMLLPRHHREWPKQFALQLPWWRSPIVGYIICPFLVAMAAITEFTLQQLGLKAYTPSAMFYLINVVIAWLWGVGPALLAIILGYFTLDIFVIPPFGIFTFNGWSDTELFLPFIITQLIVVLITTQREKAQQRARAAEQEAQARSQELAEANHALAQNNQQLEQLNDHLEEADQLKDYFFSRASHELKTPITMIRGQAQLALRRLAKSQRAPSEQSSLPTYLEKIESQTCRLQALIEDLLDMSSLHSGKMPLRPSSCNLGNLCNEVIEDQHALSGRSIKLELPTELAMLQADCQRVSQVISNLVSNAVKYSPENTVILVRIIHESSHIILTVHNDGTTIPQERQKHIFESFYRAPEAGSSSIQGWGLGLSISKEIVEQHGGRIWVDSSEEKGTIFLCNFLCQ